MIRSATLGPDLDQIHTQTNNSDVFRSYYMWGPFGVSFDSTTTDITGLHQSRTRKLGIMLNVKGLGLSKNGLP